MSTSHEVFKEGPLERITVRRRLQRRCQLLQQQGVHILQQCCGWLVWSEGFKGICMHVCGVTLADWQGNAPHGVHSTSFFENLSAYWRSVWCLVCQLGRKSFIHSFCTPLQRLQPVPFPEPCVRQGGDCVMLSIPWGIVEMTSDCRCTHVCGVLLGDVGILKHMMESRLTCADFWQWR